MSPISRFSNALVVAFYLAGAALALVSWDLKLGGSPISEIVNAISTL